MASAQRISLFNRGKLYLHRLVHGKTEKTRVLTYTLNLILLEFAVQQGLEHTICVGCGLVQIAAQKREKIGTFC